MIIRYFSILIRAVTIMLYPILYGKDGIYSLTIIGYIYTFLIVPVEIYSQYSVYNEFTINPLKSKLYTSTIYWLFSILSLSLITRFLFNEPDFIFNQVDTFLIYSSAYYLKQNSKRYYQARNLGMYKYANYMHYLITPIIFFIIQLILFFANFDKGDIYSIATFMSFIIPYFLTKYNRNINLGYLRDEGYIDKSHNIRIKQKKSNRIIFTSIYIYIMPALFFIIAGKFYGNDYKNIFIALYITQKIVDFITPSLDYFENKYPYKIKNLSRRSMSVVKSVIKKVTISQTKLSMIVITINVTISLIIVIQSNKFMTLNSEIVKTTVLLTTIILINNCFQGHDLIISRFNPNNLIKIDYLLSFIALLCLIFSVYYSTPLLIILAPLIATFIRRIYSAYTLNIYL